MDNTLHWGIIAPGRIAHKFVQDLQLAGGNRLHAVASRSLQRAQDFAAQYGARHAFGSYEEMTGCPGLDVVYVASPHSSHLEHTLLCLKNKIPVLCEKPLAMNVEQLVDIVACAKQHPEQQVMVGFNRRFSPHIQKIRQLLAGRSEPLAMNYACNAGIIPPNVWVHDPEQGGGRIVGEACHFIDLLSHIAGSPVVSVASAQMGQGVAIKEDKMSIVLSFEDGSIGTVNYFGNGNKAYPKEQLDVYSEGRILRLDNFRLLEGFGFKGFKRLKTKMDKGHRAEFKAFASTIQQGGAPLIPLAESVNATLASFAAMTSAAESRTVNLNTEYARRFDTTGETLTSQGLESGDESPQSTFGVR